MYTALAGFVTGTYSLVAVGIGEVIGGSSRASAVVATVVIAVTFEPVRQRAERLTNRVVYSPRATPYEVLSEITGRLAETRSGPELLEQVAEMSLDALGAESVSVWVTSGSGFVAVAARPPAEPSTVSGLDALGPLVAPVALDGEVLGALTVQKAHGEPLTPPEEALLEDLAGSLALVLRRRHLDAKLEATARELDRSRRRLVDVHDDERRDLEHGLSGLVGPLVLRIKDSIESARESAVEEGVSRVVAILDQLVEDTDKAVEQVRSLARGLYPPSLTHDGLEAALETLCTESPAPITIATDLRSRHLPEVEAAIYFCVTEALTNAAKHSRGGTEVWVTDRHDGELRFSVTDEGPGFDPARARGSGLRNMADRLDTLGGSLGLESTLGSPTTITGRIPVQAMASAQG